MRAREFIRAAGGRVMHALGWVAAALVLAAAALARAPAGKAGAEGKAREKNEKERKEIEENADAAYHAMHGHLSGVDAGGLCDGYGGARDAIEDGRHRLRRKFGGYREALHAGGAGQGD